MAIITRRQELRSEMMVANARVLTHTGEEREEYRRLAFEIAHALRIVEQHRLNMALWRYDNLCIVHDIPNCPCNDDANYNPRWDIPAPAVQ